MEKKTRVEVIVLSIGVFMLILVWSSLTRSPKIGVVKTGVNKNIEISFPAAPVVYNTVSTQTQQVSGIKYKGMEVRDPFDNSAVTAETPKAPDQEGAFSKEVYSVSAIIWGTKKPQAIINNKVFTIGEKLDGAQIMNIDKKGVHVNIEGREVLLSVK